MPSSARGTRGRVPRRDPLTTVFILLVYPIFLCFFSILHLIYDSSIKLIANIQWQRYIYSQVGQRPRQLLQIWWSGLDIGVAGIHTAERASEERLLKRGNIVRTVGRFVSVDKDQAALGAKTNKQRALAPQHLAFVLAPKPVQTRVLVYRAVVAALFGRKRQSKEGEQTRIEKKQVKYALDSAKTLLQCCAITGIEEVSLYDEAGRIKRALAGKREWILERPLGGQWQAATRRSDFKHEQLFSAPHSESSSSSTATTPRSSYSSAMSSAPSLHKRTSKGSLHDVCKQDFTSRSDSSSALLRLTACLYCPSYDCETLAEESSSIGSIGQVNVYNAKIKVNLLDSEDAKNAIAKAASRIANSPDTLKTIEVKTIDNVLQAYGYPSEPDLLIIHGGNRRVRTLHGFPPWLVRLCEIYYDQSASPYRPLSSVSIEGAIASFSRSEQRYGR